MLILFIILFFARSVMSDGDTRELNSNSLRVEEGLLCSNGVLSASHYVGLPASQENYFNGTFNFDRFFFMGEGRVELRLRAPATLTLDPKYGRVLKRGNSFHFRLARKDGASSYPEFQVRGLPYGDFPAVDELYYSGSEICTEKTDWKPTLFAVQDSDSLNDVRKNSTAINRCGLRKLTHQGVKTDSFSAQEGDWPWHAAIYHIDRHASKYSCGGALISSTVVLTAGHCITENFMIIVPERIIVKLGQYNRLVSNSNAREYGVFKIIAHKDFNPVSLNSDIAILKLSTEVTFTDYIQPVCLWDRSLIDLDKVIGKRGHVVGWGLNQESTLSDILSQTSMPIVSSTTCLNSKRQFFDDFLTDKNYCAGFSNGTTICNGNSGGGMYFKTGGTYKIRGIVSLIFLREKEDLCKTMNYVIFTDVAKYLDWIIDMQLNA